MKTKNDPRHKIRVITVKSLFEKSFRPDLKFSKDSFAAEVMTYQKEIDNLISHNAPAWPICQISPIDLATLRLAVWELLFKKPKEPYRAIVDEAVEIAKDYGTESSGSFVNGVLGSIIRSKLKSGNSYDRSGKNLKNND